CPRTQTSTHTIMILYGASSNCPRPIPTGVTDLNTTVTKAQIVYTVDGRLVRQNVTSLEGLDAGLYIFGGKKVAVK
ncbi:MAG: hypothetical protein KBT10_08435, partial [Bacteroidales bacterium]|nr:hypothetical protein [Candidatus Sodaliphilus aphodohippi]